MVVHGLFGFGFDHDAGQGFGAGVADDDAAGVLRVPASAARMRAATVGMLSSGIFSRTLTLTMTWGKTLRSAVSSSMALPVRAIRSRTTQRGEQAVAGGGEVGKQDVAGLLAAESRVVFQHLLEDVAVADGSAEHANAGALESGFEAHVGHGGGDDEVIGEEAARLEVAGGHEQDGVAVDRRCLGAGQHAAVGVAVEGEAEVGTAFGYLGGNPLGMEGAAVVVDVAAVGSDVEQGDVAAQSGEELGGDGCRSAVGAVDDDAQSGKVEAGDGVEEELDVIGRERGIVFNERQRNGIGRGHVGGMVQDFVFNGQFERIGELEAVAAEELDAVVVPGIVGGGDDDAGAEAVGAGEKGDGGGGDRRRRSRRSRRRRADRRRAWRRSRGSIRGCRGRG